MTALLCLSMLSIGATIGLFVGCAICGAANADLRAEIARLRGE